MASFLDLPKKARMMIYASVFSGSTIVADANFSTLRPTTTMDLNNYHCAVTHTCKLVRNESRPLLLQATTFLITANAIHQPFYLKPRWSELLEKIEKIRVLISTALNDWCAPVERIIRHCTELRTLECCINYNRRDDIYAGVFNRDATFYMFSPWNPHAGQTPDADAEDKACQAGESPVRFNEATSEWMEGRYQHAAAVLSRPSSFELKMMVVAQYYLSSSYSRPQLSPQVHYDVLFADMTSTLADNKCSTLAWLTMGKHYEHVP